MKQLMRVILCIIISLQSTAQTKPVKWIVARDGSGNYKTVQEAFDAVPPASTKPVIIFVKKGIYKEKLHLDLSKNYVTLVGEGKDNTILTYDDHTGKVTPKGDTINTRTSASFVVAANDFRAENLSIENTAGFTAGQAVGLEVRGDRAFIKNCRIVGNQDILFTSAEDSRQYYLNCYIEGTTDFIFGAATVWFQDCHIHSKKESHITAASTPQSHAVGYVFKYCTLTGDTGLHSVSLGRPWRPYASVTYLHCNIGSHIKAEGWSAWNNMESYKTARYAEYENYGPGAARAGRVSWAKQLTAEEAKWFTLENVFGDWQPGK